MSKIKTMADIVDNSPLPPGWDRKYDHNTGRHYFINYFNKSTTWEDPRVRYRQLSQGTPQHVPSGSVIESIPMQHGSPDLRGYHIYPSNSSYYPPQHAFQNPAPYTHTSVHFQDLTNIRPSPIPNRAFAPNMVSQVVSAFGSPARFVESSLTTDPEQSVAKISGMFPTVTETHIKTLLMKYHNREALVMSALQVEKHPMSTPGPYATPPPLGRHFSVLQMTPPLGIRGDSPRTGSPIPRPGSGGSGSYIGSPRIGDNYQRPHSSPKMKLRYLKSVFPKGDETLLLDVLNNSDNNVQKASETLVTMGFEKRDTPPPRLVLKKKEEEAKALLEKQQATPTPPPRMKSHEEKQKMKTRLQDQYKDIPERVVTIALDSVDYDEERAAQILQIMVQEDSKPKVIEPEVSSKENIREAYSTPVVMPELTPAKDSSPTCNVTATPEKSFEKHRRSKGKKDVPKVSRGTSTTEDKEYKSPYLMKVCGPSHELYKGPNDQLLLTDYVTWNGPNTDLLGKNNGRVSFAKGPNKSLQKVHACLAKGPNIDIWKGPKKGLAKGSIYSQLTAKNSANESRAAFAAFPSSLESEDGSGCC